MNNIVMDESTRDKIISKLISYKDETLTAKHKKLFACSKKWLSIAASTAVVLLFCSIFFPIMIIKQGGAQMEFQYDYYTEYKFELPFKHKNTTQSDSLFFDATFTIEQMTGLINDAGYKARMYDFDNVKRIFITAAQNNFLYYFAIYDNNYLESSKKYTLTNLTSSIVIDSNWQIDKNMYVFLFPLHLAKAETNPLNTKKIYCTFDEFAEFYEATGRSDTKIDRINKTVVFFCEGSVEHSWGNANWARGNIIMRYVESESGNYVDIQPQQ